jgi:hypothetical protein
MENKKNKSNLLSSSSTVPETGIFGIKVPAL